MEGFRETPRALDNPIIRRRVEDVLNTPSVVDALSLEWAHTAHPLRQELAGLASQDGASCMRELEERYGVAVFRWAVVLNGSDLSGELLDEPSTASDAENDRSSVCLDIGADKNEAGGSGLAAALGHSECPGNIGPCDSQNGTSGLHSRPGPLPPCIVELSGDVKSLTEELHSERAKRSRLEAEARAAEHRAATLQSRLGKAEQELRSVRQEGVQSMGRGLPQVG
jgi:hypothetical protein